ncbi:MAG: helix-turn-helix domain-containing protein [Clostridia bacterium]|nr:helix-turn-helix domain-containing protein [Clostridia bacterium]
MRYEIIASDELAPPAIKVIGYSSDAAVARFGPGVRDQYIIHYVLSGEGYFNGNKVKMGEGFLIAPGMKEEYFPDEQNPWSFLWIISEDAAMQGYFDRIGAAPKTNIFRIAKLDEIEAVATSIKNSQKVLASTAELSEMFLHIMNSTLVTTHSAPNTVSYFEFSRNHIEMNLHLSVEVAELCRLLGVTQPYIYKIFKSNTGMSPKQYINECKMKRARKMLSETELSISAISDALGFSSPLDFSKFFKKHEKVCASEYRRCFLVAQ